MNVKNRSMTITAEVVVSSGGANGGVLARFRTGTKSRLFGGWCRYMKDIK
jgi:hypothetical protein